MKQRFLLEVEVEKDTKDMAKWREDTILFGGEHDVATSNYGGKTNTYRYSSTLWYDTLCHYVSAVGYYLSSLPPTADDQTSLISTTASTSAQRQRISSGSK